MKKATQRKRKLIDKTEYKRLHKTWMVNRGYYFENQNLLNLPVRVVYDQRNTHNEGDLTRLDKSWQTRERKRETL